MIDAPRSIGEVLNGRQIQPVDIPEDCYFVPQHIDARMAAQFSIFTLHADPYRPLEKSKIDAVWFKGECKELIFAELHVLSVNAKTMFPGLSGIGERIRNAKFGQY